MKRVLIVETNIRNYYNTTEVTGLWFSEMANFISQLQKNNINFDFMSPLGGFVPLDPKSMTNMTNEMIEIYKENNLIQSGLAETMNPYIINVNKYVAIYYTGGHGAIYDFPDNEEIQNIAKKIYQNNGYILSVSHGVTGLLNIKDDNGQYIINNKKITGFTKEEEQLSHTEQLIPFFNEDLAINRNATFIKEKPYQDNVVQDGRIITGQNSSSTTSLAKKFIEEINKKN